MFSEKMDWAIALPSNMRKNNMTKLMGDRNRPINHSSNRWRRGRDLWKGIEHHQGITLQNEVLNQQILSKCNPNSTAFASTSTAPRAKWIFLLQAPITDPSESLMITPMPADFWTANTAPSTLILYLVGGGGVQLNWVVVLRLEATQLDSWNSIKNSKAS